jgi:hypothetical protein
VADVDLEATSVSLPVNLPRRGHSKYAIIGTIPLSTPDDVLLCHSIALLAPVFYDSAQRTGEVPVVHDQRKLVAVLAADVVGYSAFCFSGETASDLGGVCWIGVESALPLEAGSLPCSVASRLCSVMAGPRQHKAELVRGR